MGVTPVQHQPWADVEILSYYVAVDCPSLHEPIKYDLGRRMSLFTKPFLAAQLGI